MGVGSVKVPVKVSHSNNCDGSKIKSKACLASDGIYSKKTQNTGTAVFFLFSQFGICFLNTCGGLRDVSDHSLGQDAVSSQTAHQGE